jgi:hypothetical protein
MWGPIFQVRLQRLARFFVQKSFHEKFVINVISAGGSPGFFLILLAGEVVPFFQISLAELCPGFFWISSKNGGQNFFAKNGEILSGQLRDLRR